MKKQGGNTVLYLSVFDWPVDGKLMVPGVNNEVLSASLLANGKKLKTEAGNDGLQIHVPGDAPDSIASVIKLEIKGNMAED
jgi:alpha-L-fucosidase